MHNLHNYVFMQKGRFLEHQHQGTEHASFLGEIYEAYFYESLLQVLQQESCPMRLVAKGPYASLKRHYIKTGFFSTVDGKCVYNMQGSSFAEFDCLAISANEVYFYECSISNKCNITLRKELLKKKTLLAYLFPQHRIVPVVVSEHEAVVAYCNRWQSDGIEAWLFKMPNIDCVQLAQNNQPKTLPKPEQVMSLQELNYLIGTAPYFEHLQTLTQALAKYDSLHEVHVACEVANNHWLSRWYWGKIPGAWTHLPQAQAHEEVLVVIDFSKNAYPVLRYYVHDASKKQFFEFAPQLQLVKRIKFSRLELSKTLPWLQVKKQSAWLNLQAELQQVRQKTAKPQTHWMRTG